MIKPEVLDAMVAAGCTAQQIAAAVKADQAGSSGAARQARYRARKASQSDERDVTTVTVTDDLSPKKETSPTPPKEKTTPSNFVMSPRDELAAVLDAERAGAVIEHRQRLRKPLTAYAAKQLAKSLSGFVDPNAAADKMIESGWLKIDPKWGDRPTNSTAPPRKKVTQANMWDDDAIALGIRNDPSNQTDRSLDAGLPGGQNQGHGYPRLVAGS